MKTLKILLGFLMITWIPKQQDNPGHQDARQSCGIHVDPMAWASRLKLLLDGEEMYVDMYATQNIFFICKIKIEISKIRRHDRGA